jgi:tetratricopeptide (TPR) repeat protein
MKSAAVAVLWVACSALAGDFERANELAFSRRFAEAEALYRTLPATPETRLALARVVLWQGRYAEAAAMFDALEGVEALEGKASAQYWSGDWRSADRTFRHVLETDPGRESGQKALREIAAATRPSQRIGFEGVHDDQPLDLVRGEIAATLFSDPQTRWTFAFGQYAGDASGHFASIANQTTLRGLTVNAAAGLFTWPDGVRRPVGSARLQWRSFSARLERAPEIASAASFGRHVASTTTALRWETSRHWLASAELAHRTYSDDNDGWSAVAYAVAPVRRSDWTFWGGASVAARDTSESRFSSAGVYDPYWTPDDLREARAVVAIERRIASGAVKLHGDGGYAQDKGRAFDIPYDRSYRPWRLGLATDLPLTPNFRIEAGVTRGATVDYRSTTYHAALVRRH